MHGHHVSPSSQTRALLPSAHAASGLVLFNMVAPPLCECGKRLEEEFELRNGMCWECQCVAANCTNELEPVRPEVSERFNCRSRHFHGKATA